MADVKNIITLGIGASPGYIRHFVLVGLDTGVFPAAPLSRTFVVSQETRTLPIEQESRTLVVQSESRVLAVR
jgi:hypothetical protein